MNSDFINVSKMGLSNKKKLFNIIRYNPGITRREIARIAGMNPSSVTNITNSLKEMGLITEEGTKKSPQPGRNSIRLEAIKEAAIVFVFHMGVEQTIFGIGYLNNMIELKEEFETEKDTEHFFDKVSEISKKYIREIGRKPVGIYFSLPGLVDRKNGVIYTLPNVGWKNIDVKAEIEKNVYPDLTVFLDVPSTEVIKRLDRDNLDRLEREKEPFFRRVREGYLWLAEKHSDRFIRFNALKAPGRIHEEIMDVLYRKGLFNSPD